MPMNTISSKRIKLTDLTNLLEGVDPRICAFEDMNCKICPFNKGDGCDHLADVLYLAACYNSYQKEVTLDSE